MKKAGGMAMMDCREKEEAGNIGVFDIAVWLARR
jgi:hypothetical protein